MEIIPENLDITIKDGYYAIYNCGTVLQTPEGSEFAHSNIRLLHQILRELTFDQRFNDSHINCSSIFCNQKDFVESGLGLLTRSFDEILECDPFMRRKYLKDTGEVPERTIGILSELDNLKIPLHFIYGGTTVVSRVFNDFLLERMPKGFDISLINFANAAEIIRDYYFSLSDYKKAAINLLAKYHLSGVITPMFLVNLWITPSEYANAAVNLNLSHFRNDKVYDRHIRLLEYENEIPPVIRLETVRQDFERIRNEALSAIEYVLLVSQEIPGKQDLSELLKAGESYSVEYKSTLRMNLKSEKKDANIEHASLKTIAAFLNSGGGVLLIGVDDKSGIVGIETDDFDNEDRFSLHFWNLVKTAVGQDISAFLQTGFETVEDKTVFIVRCSKSTRPVFLKQSGFGEEFYIRVGPSSAKLDISEALKYINERFDKI